MPRAEESEVHLSATDTRVTVADMGSNVAVIVTHPWALLGGNQHNNVVVAAVLYFQKLGFTTARFDFNGTGLGRGYVQMAQVEAVAKALLSGSILSKHKSKPPQHILLIGYSYGSLIAQSASAKIPECMACISIAPPFSVSHWLLMFHSSYHMEWAVERENLPRLLLLGSRDNFTSEHVFQETIQANYPVENTTGAVLKDADHFFHRREKDVMDVIGQWLMETFPQCQGSLRELRKLSFGLTNTS